MAIVTFLPTGRSIEVEAGTELVAAARAAGIDIETPCGGKGTCGNCVVRVSAGEVDSNSLGTLPREAVAEGFVLACQTRVLDTPVTVHVSGGSQREGGKISQEDETYLVRQELLPKEWQFDPLAIKWLFQVPPPQPEDGLSDLDRLTRTIQREWGPQEVVCAFGVIRELASALRAEDGVVTATIVRDGSRLSVVRCEPGNRTTRHYAIAIDVGTTTVAVQLVNLTVAKILATRSAYNDQVSCGLDVISRINYAKRPGGLEELRGRVLKTINGLLSQVTRTCGVEPHEISNAVVSANTTMTHLLLGLEPEYIRLDPYTPTVLEVPYLTAAEVGIDINPDSWICFSPNSGSYVGGDISAGLLCTDLAAGTDEISLFIDIGTNGEVVVGNRDFLMGCACSAGPAFEGSGIDCGMRAALGAIERVEVDAATGVATYRTIGDAPPQGICGSGMIELLANLFATGWIDPAGKLDRARPSPAIKVEGKRARYTLAPAGEGASGEAITISELDIENIVRAKAAIYSACSLMLQQIGIGFDDLANVYIAGGFGRFLDLEKAVILGLAPDVPRERFHFVGNASLMGSYMVVVSQEYRRRELELARRMTYIDLSTTPGYMDEYMAALFLPHTDRERFPTVNGQTGVRIQEPEFRSRNPEVRLDTD
jgi:uncharacterized 2Fe-2S/4Fe-4S cluster protein (DUF4445 family)